MLNPDLDLLLTALLDGELETEPRLRVESAVRGDPAAAERLAAMTRVRDLVATLPPPDPTRDLSGEVVAFLASRRRSSLRTFRFAGAIVSGLAAAALLMVMLGRLTPRPGAGPELAQLSKPRKPRQAPPAPPFTANLARPPRPILAQPTLDVAIPQDVLVAEIRDRDDRAGLDGLLRQDGVQAVDLLVDQIGPSTLDILDEVVRTTSRVRPNHARVHVVQGFEFDPARPGRAYAYVLVMDEHEYARFRRKLDERFPDSTSELEPVPRDALASLSKVGRIEFFRDTPPAGTLKRPPADLLTEVAIQSPRREGQDEVFITPRGKMVRPGTSTVRPSPTEKTPAIALKPDGAPTQSPRLVYVVWVSPRERPRG